jgi:hypothetical protein
MMDLNLQRGDCLLRDGRRDYRLAERDAKIAEVEARLAEFRGRPAYRIENAGELQPLWFSGAEDVGIIIGATNLEPVVRDVRDRLIQFAAFQQKGMLEGLAQ